MDETLSGFHFSGCFVHQFDGVRDVIFMSQRSCNLISVSLHKVGLYLIIPV